MRKILKESEKTRNHISILEYLQSLYLAPGSFWYIYYLPVIVIIEYNYNIC